MGCHAGEHSCATGRAAWCRAVGVGKQQRVSGELSEIGGIDLVAVWSDPTSEVVTVKIEEVHGEEVRIQKKRFTIKSTKGMKNKGLMTGDFRLLK